MIDMKTLKDIVFNINMPKEVIDPSDLRQAAIEWVKWLTEHSQAEIVFNEVKSSAEAYAAVYDRKFLRDRDNFNASRLRNKRLAAKEWIMEFFNLTEKDLEEKSLFPVLSDNLIDVIVSPGHIHYKDGSCSLNGVDDLTPRLKEDLK